MAIEQPKPVKALHWIGSSKKDLKAFPDDVQDACGHELWSVQLGEMPRSAKVMRGFGGADVVELVENYDGDTYRVVYTIRFRKAVYVLHAFEKKSKHGTKTAQNDIGVVKSRLRTATEDYARRYSDER